VSTITTPSVRLLALLLLSVTIVAVVGCGDDDDRRDSRAPSATPYQQGYERVGRMLTEGSRRARPPAGKVPTPRQLGQSYRRLQQMLNRAATNLDALSPPDRVAEPHRRMVDALRAAARAYGPSIAAGLANDRALLRKVTDPMSATHARLSQAMERANHQISEVLSTAQ
jgi:hypothetical protein